MRIGSDHRSHILRDALITAAKRHGGGILGFLRELAIKHPERFVGLLRRALILETTRPVADEESKLTSSRHMQKIFVEGLRNDGLSEERITESVSIWVSLCKKVGA